MDQFSVKSNLLHQKAPTSRDWPNKLIIFEIDSETFSQCSWVFIDAFRILSNICDGYFRKKTVSSYKSIRPTCSLVSLKNIPFLFLFKIAFDFREIETEFGYHTKVMLSSLMAWFLQFRIVSAWLTLRIWNLLMTISAKSSFVDVWPDPKDAIEFQPYSFTITSFWCLYC